MVVLNEPALFSESCSVDILVEHTSSTQPRWCLGLLWPLPKCHQSMKYVHQKCQYDVHQLWGEVFFPPSLPWTHAAAILSQCLRVLLCCYVTLLRALQLSLSGLHTLWRTCSSNQAYCSKLPPCWTDMHFVETLLILEPGAVTWCYD